MEIRSRDSFIIPLMIEENRAEFFTVREDLSHLSSSNFVFHSQENKQAEQHLHSTLDVISNYFSKTEGAELIKESVETFSRPLVVLLSR